MTINRNNAMMNIRYILPACCLLLACQGEQPHDIMPTLFVAADTVAIAFGADVDGGDARSTRGHAVAGTRAADDYRGKGEWTTERLRQTAFGVYCWYTGTTDFDNFATHGHIGDYLGASGYMLMRNQRVDYGTTPTQPIPAWHYSPVKFWPLNGAEKLTLRAYAPYVAYNLVTDAQGLPQLPVMVEADDYCNDCQHDPLWGTSRHDSGGDATGDNNVFGRHYDNYTRIMSGNLLTADPRDGIIDWYFHHGMAKFGLQAMVQNPTPGTVVRVTGIYTGPFYNQGLLDIFRSESRTVDDKPIWTERSYPVGDDFYVDIRYHHADASAQGYHDDLTGVALSGLAYTNVAVNGLLVIPRDYRTTPMLVRVTYTEENESTGEVTATKTMDGYVNFNVVGNTVYALQMLLNVESNTLYIRSFVNHDWQVGSYKLLEL